MHHKIISLSILIILINIYSTSSLPLSSLFRTGGGGVGRIVDVGQMGLHELKMAKKFESKASEAIKESQNHFTKASKSRFSIMQNYHLNKAKANMLSSQRYQQHAATQNEAWLVKNPEFLKTPYDPKSPYGTPIGSPVR